MTLIAKGTKWDVRFINMARHIAEWSKDPGIKVGAVIVRPDRTVCSVGYNGFPRGMPDDDPVDREDKLSRTIHAEMNALLTAREPVHGYALFSSFLPCDRCFVHLAQAGIQHFCAPWPNPTKFGRWEPAFERTRKYVEEMNLTLYEIVND